MPPPAVIPATGPRRRFFAALGRPAGAALVIFLVALAAYGGSLRGEFLWDDLFLVERNPLIRSPALAFEAFRHFLFIDSPATFYRPVQTLTYVADYALWGLDPFGYRFTNLLLHAAVGWGVYLLGRRLLPWLTNSPTNDGPALGVALLWVVHPVHAGAVAYVAGRADSLASGFALLAWALYETTAARRTSRFPHAAGYALAAAALLTALLSKELAAVWVALFGLRLALVPDGRGWAHRGRAFAGTLLCLAVYATLRLTLPTIPPGMVAPSAPILAGRTLLMARALGDYAGLLLWPGRLCMERQVFAAYGPEYNPGLDGYHAALTFVGPACLALLVGLAAWPGPARRLRAFGAAWFLVAFLPISNLFLLNASVAEHWLYVPSVGALFLGVGTLWRFVPDARARAVATALLLTVALPALGWRTARRALEWADRSRFPERTIAAGGDSPRMRNLLATTLVLHGDLTGGENVLRGLLRQSPSNATAQLNLANNLRRQGRVPEAAALYAEVVAHPSAFDVRPLPLALAALDELAPTGVAVPPPPSTGFPSTAETLDAALARTPQSWELLSLRCRNLRRAGQPREALRRVADYLRVCPWRYDAQMLAGDLRAGLDDLPGALEAYAAAGRLDTREYASRLRRAGLLAAAGRAEEARAMLLAARARHPDLPPRVEQELLRPGAP